ncbi:MAG: hypothetical protein WC998_02595 [Candidatus Paceibacterota bacterium]
MKILEMGKGELLKLKPEDVTRLLSAEEVLHIAKVLGAFWMYDYKAKKPGMHALLKSGQHSDGFFVSRILLSFKNIRMIISNQMAMKIREAKIQPDRVVGVPNGATELGRDIARILGAKRAKMEKNDGKIVFSTKIKSEDSILIVEDFCTRGTGFAEAVRVVSAQSGAYIFPYNPVIINRGGLKYLSVKWRDYTILPVVEIRIKDWDPNQCELCKAGSVAIKPKETDENWKMLNNSQVVET